MSFHTTATSCCSLVARVSRSLVHFLGKTIVLCFTQVELVLVISVLTGKFRYFNNKIDLAIFQEGEEGELKSENILTKNSHSWGRWPGPSLKTSTTMKITIIFKFQLNKLVGFFSTAFHCIGLNFYLRLTRYSQPQTSVLYSGLIKKFPSPTIR